jgi:nucleoside phosphorylase
MGAVDHHDFCIICAKPEELAQVLRVFEGNFKKVKGQRLTDHVFVVGNYKVKLTACSVMGNMHAAVRTAQVILSSHPQIVFFVGTAASLIPSEIQLGDVVVPRKAVSRIYEKVSELGQRDYENRAKRQEFEEFSIQTSKNALIADLETRNCSEDGLNAFAALDINDVKLETGSEGNITIGGQTFALRAPRVHQDIDIFSCGMVVDSVSYREMIARITDQNFRKASAIDMESLGFFRAIEAAQTMDVGFKCDGLMIRGISDYAGRKRETEARPDGWKDKAVRNAAIVTGDLMKKLATM